MSEPTLLPCPFCAHEDIWLRDYDTEFDAWIIECQNPKCRAAIRSGISLEAVAAAWNTRAPVGVSGQAWGPPLPAPDGPGWWAFEGECRPGRRYASWFPFQDVLKVKAKLQSPELYVLHNGNLYEIWQFRGAWYRVLPLPWETRPPAAAADTESGGAE